MTFTYNSPPMNPREEVRFWSTDTVEKPYSVSDEDINYLLSPEQLNGNVMAAAAIVADRIANYWAASTTTGGGDVKIGPFSVPDARESTDLEASWRALAARLRSGSPDGSMNLGARMFTGGGQPEFSVGMMDNGLQRYRDRSRESERPANGVW